MTVVDMPARLPWDRGLDRPDFTGAHCLNVHGFTEIKTKVAKEFCRPEYGPACPVLEACRDYGLQMPLHHATGKTTEAGPVYGGLSALELRRYKENRYRRQKAS